MTNAIIEKSASFVQEVQALGMLPDSVHYEASPAQHYRGRIEFHMLTNPWSYAMFDAQKNYVRLSESTVALLPIAQRMQPLLQWLERHNDFGYRLFQTNWRANTQGEVLLTLVYHCALSESWLEQASVLAADLGVQVIGRSRKQKRLVQNGYLDNTIDLEGRKLVMRQDDVSFSQPNLAINQAMISWLRHQLTVCKDDLLELYCGIGNFSCALADRFRKVFATEVVRSAITLCKYNIERNRINNVEVVRLSAAESVQALSKERTFNRLRAIDLDTYRFTHLLVDPPRCGLDDMNRDFAQRFDTIIYISCNPNSWLEDMSAWSEEYNIEALGFFDQFPDTPHVELISILKRK